MVSSPRRLLACSGSLEGGGSERQLWQLVSRLDRHRFAPELFLLYRRGPYLKELPSDVSVHAFDDQPYLARRRLLPGSVSIAQVRCLRQWIATSRIDVVYDRTFHMTLITSAACGRKVPRVSVIVSPPSRDFPTTEKRFVWIKRWLLRRAYRSATATVCVSQEVADDAARYYGLDRQRLIVMPNPIDVGLIRRRAAEESLRLATADLPSAGRIDAALIGRFTAEKGHRFAIDVAAQIQKRYGDAQELSLHLHLVGNGPLENELREQVERLGLKQRVHFYGYLTNPYPLLGQCDMCFVPSRYEGFPNVALEALALGVPLLMNDYGPTAREIVGAIPMRGRLIDCGSESSAVVAIEDLHRCPDRWRAVAESGKMWVEKEHSIDSWLVRMMDLLERVSPRGKAKELRE